MEIIPSLLWRYATKRFDPEKKLTSAQVDEILEAARLAPSSFGLAPWKFILVTDEKLRARIREEAGHQAQMTDASHLVVVCAQDDISEEYIHDYVAYTAKVRGMPPEALKGFADVMIGFRRTMNQEQTRAWAERQTYIALGFLLETAALRRIDACPMEGFESKKVDKILDLEEHGVHSVAMVALGHRAQDDKYASATKVRAPKDLIVVEK